MRFVFMSLAVMCAAVAPALAQDKATGTQPSAPPGAQAGLTVALKDANGASVGSVRIRPLAHGTLFIANLENLPPGLHGFHIHERGACDAPGFETAGGHYNPAGKSHGFDSPGGYHAGDLPNIRVGEDGKAAAELHSSLLTLERQVASAGESAATAATGAGGGTPGATAGGAAGANPAGAGAPYAMLDDDGSAIMIHAMADDYRSETSGSAGSRIACGVIER